MPAAVDSAALALAKYGTKSLSEVLAPAIALADGFPMYKFLRALPRDRTQGACDPYAWSMRTYYPGGKVTSAGEIFRQPNLAALCARLPRPSSRRWRGGGTREQAIQAGRDAF